MRRTAFNLPRRFWSVLVLLLALQIPTVVAAAEPARVAAGELVGQPAVAERLSEGFSAALERARAGIGVNGLTMAVLTADGRQWAGAAGTDPDGAPLSPDSPVTIGSVTKTFTAAIVLALVDEGKIGLDDPASKYLPKAKLARDVTVRQLLDHTSGIADLYGPMLGYFDRSPGRALGSNDVLGRVGPNNFAPGTGYRYSNTNYYLLGHIIEVVTHNRFNDVLKARFTERLHLDSTRLLTGEDASPLPPAWSTAFWTSGAMVSTPGDLVQWGRALYGGDLLSPATKEQMLDFSAGHEYGLGAQLLPLGNWTVPGHSGLLYSTTTLLLYVPEHKLTIAIAATEPRADLETALVHRYGAASLMDFAGSLSR